jgi:hypothetical protein
MSPRITTVRYLGQYRLELTFTDGVRGEIDLKDQIVGQGGVFKALENPDYFRLVRVNEDFGTIQWPNDADFCPDVLYSHITGKPIAIAALI